MTMTELAEASRLETPAADRFSVGDQPWRSASAAVEGCGESRFVVDIVGRGAAVDQVGGKAVGIDRLAGHGFPVPRTLAVHTKAYRYFVESAGLEPTLRELVGGDIPPADQIEVEADQIDRLFLDAPMPRRLDRDLRAAVCNLLISGPIAVRSSATAEDLASASFAGQYRTVLEIESEDEALDAIRLCWASLWGPSVRTYRRLAAIPEHDLAMGVVLQAMVPARHAGVVFTRDPLGDSDTSRVEIVEGLGEALVSGRVTPDDFRVDRFTLAVRGDHEIDVPDFLEDLARMCFSVERRMGTPQDVEWAHDGEKILLLQTRPITRRNWRPPDDDGFDTEPREGHTYTSLGIGEMLPGTLPPLLWSINAPMLSDAFRHLFADLGIEGEDWKSSPVVTRFRGRAALDLSILRDAAASLPGGSASEVERQYLGHGLTTDEQPRRSGGVRHLLAGLKAVRIRNRVEDEVSLFVDASSFVPALRVPVNDLSTHRLLTYRSRIRDLAWRGYQAEVAASAGAAASYRAVELALERWVGKESAAGWAQRVTLGRAATDRAGTNLTGEPWDLYIGNGHGHPTCDCLLEEMLEIAGSGPTVADDTSAQFLEGLHRMMRHFASTALYAGPTWDEVSTTVCSTTVCVCDASMACCEASGQRREWRPTAERETREQAFDALVSLLRNSWKWRLTRIVTGQIVDMRRRMLRKLVTDATRYLSLRERAKSALLILGGEERRLIQEAARRLVASGLLREDDEVLHLSDQELTAMLLGREPISAMELELRREAYTRAEQGDPLPETFEGRPGSVQEAPIQGNRLIGQPASPGTCFGTARVILTVAAGSTLEPGDILVAPRTDPSWMPLLAIAGGIVLEEGGPLSHAAIVSREFGIPAVFNVRGATQVVSDGDSILVDGTEGVVTRVTKDRLVIT